jgi:voltage-gated sodium channel
MKLLLNDRFVLSLIIFNAIVLFLISFETILSSFYFLHYVDLFISLIFIIEMFYKIKLDSFSVYWKDSWNKLDFFINITIMPSLFLFFISDIDFLFLTILRLGRVFKFLRFFKYIPNIEHLMRGIKRSFKSSLFVVIAFFIYMFIVSILSCFLYKGILPEYFKDPLISLYSIFKIFTIEGWYEIPDLIASKTSENVAFFSKIYFIFLLLTGGICGLSLINAIFVDELVADNNDQLEKKIDKIVEYIENQEKNNK